jgi:PHD/YefM family antitoxin component YafN of YafNO toxin-antitoxin module
LGDLVAEIRKAGGRVLLTRKGRAAGVALDLNSYRSIMDQVEQIEAMRVFNVASMILRPSAR